MWMSSLPSVPPPSIDGHSIEARYAGVTVRVKLRNPDRVVEVDGPATVRDLLAELDIVPEAVLVIRDATLLTRDESLLDTDEIEVRPVLSGGER